MARTTKNTAGAARAEKMDAERRWMRTQLKYARETIELLQAAQEARRSGAENELEKLRGEYRTEKHNHDVLLAKFEALVSETNAVKAANVVLTGDYVERREAWRAVREAQRAIESRQQSVVFINKSRPVRARLSRVH